MCTMKVEGHLLLLFSPHQSHPKPTPFFLVFYLSSSPLGTCNHFIAWFYLYVVLFIFLKFGLNSSLDFAICRFQLLSLIEYLEAPSWEDLK